jgi:threonine dehydrogenase-like Zn-dependent dehydrogenase
MAQTSYETSASVARANDLNCDSLTASPPDRAATASTYRVAVVAGPRAVRLETKPLPAPGPGQVRVRLEGCGVCGSNLSVWEGRPWFNYPLAPGAPGHEGWGRVDEVGAGVDGIRVGERVAVLSYNAYGEYDIAEAVNAVVLPTALDGQPFPGEALGCAMNVFRRADIHVGQNVAVIGIGFLGAVLVSLIARSGARVIAITRRPAALELARQMGASDLIAMDDHQKIITRVNELTNGRGCERVIEATGFQWPLDLAGEVTAERGKLIIAGYHQDGPRQVNLQLWNWRGLDVINAHERDPAIYVRGMREAVEAVATGRLDPRPLYTHQFRLDELSDALDSMRERNGSFMKALLKYE